MGKTGTTISVSEETLNLIRENLDPSETYDDRLRKWAEREWGNPEDADERE
jgi:hypothetical protein